ncbi:MAG: hypothetical protein ACE5I7_17145, partial [Candidatus Binatia bacterium]
MSRNIIVGTLGLVLAIGLFLCGRATAQPCLGDCNGNGAVTAGELTKVIAVILQCGGVADGCASVSGGCVNADKNGNGTITAGELTNIIFDILNFPTGCPVVEGTPTNTVPPATNTPTRTPTVPPPPTATDTPMPQAAVCGDGVVQTGEDCDDGGICIGTSNAGTTCTSDADCTGTGGVCIDSPNTGQACTSDADCSGGRCVKCRTFGGDGCAANCTTETDVPFQLLPGELEKVCEGGANDGMPCSGTVDCIPGGRCNQRVKAGTSGAFVHDGILQLPLPLTATQTLTIGKERDGQIPLVIKAASVHFPSIDVGQGAAQIACACTRGVAAKSCGGTLTEANGDATINCTPGFTPGDSECAGQKPCTFVNGPGNGASGVIGCTGLDGTDLTFTQVSSPNFPPDPAPTPPPGSGPPMITLSGGGGPGSAIVLNTAAIGTVTGKCTCDPAAPGADCRPYGPDLECCTDDDPQHRCFGGSNDGGFC